MKRLKTIFSYLLCLMIILGAFSTTPALAADNISAKYSRDSVDIGYTIESPFNAPANGVKYTSSNNKIATVSSDGRITGISLGKAKITASYGGDSATCEVSVGFQTGLDVSTYQGKLDWKKVKDAGIEFVFIRVASGKTTPGEMDTQLLNNVKGARENGIPYGFYFYSYAKSTDDIDKEIKQVLGILDKLNAAGNYASTASLPFAFDIEDSSQTGLGKKKLTQMTVKFCNAIRDEGYSPMVYANENWYTNYLELDTLIDNGYSIWFARWPDSPNFSKKITIGDTGVVPHVWQYTSSGSVAGQRVDMNVMYYDTMAQINKNHEENPGNMGGLTFSSIADVVYHGGINNPDFKVYDGETELVPNVDYTVSYSNNINAGTGIISITGMGKYFGVRKTTFNILPKPVEITVDPIPAQAYAAAPIIPAITVRTSYGAVLTQNVDYAVSGVNNTSLGKASLTVNCIGNYSGSATAEFEIIPKDIGYVSLDAIENQPYTGAAITPQVIMHNGDSALILGTDFTAEYTNNYNIGTATVLLKGIGNYTGERSYTFSIVPPTVKKLKAQTKSKSKISLSWKAVAGADRYEIYDGATKKVIKTVKGSATSTSITKLKAGSVHYFRIRAYKNVGGVRYTGYYSDYTKRATSPNKVRLTTKKGKVTAKWTKSKNSSGYVLQYAYNHKMKGAKKITIKSAKTVKKTIKNLKKGKYVYVRLRVITKQNGKASYTPYGAKRKIKIK
jgi:GH25 family lysozyme M1 (1,4-beta-N-acetylmuramidase)